MNPTNDPNDSPLDIDFSYGPDDESKTKDPKTGNIIRPFYHVPKPGNKFGMFISSVSPASMVNLLTLILIILAIPVTVFVARQQQEIRQRAAEEFTLSISGYVFIDANNNGIKEENETGYPGAKIAINGIKTNIILTTSYNGFYAIKDLPQGYYTSELAVPDGYAITTSNPVIINDGQNKINSELKINFGINRLRPAPSY